MFRYFHFLHLTKCVTKDYLGGKQGYIFWPFPPPLGGEILSKMKNREEFEGGLHEKRKGKGGKRRKKKREKEKREKEKREKAVQLIQI